MDKEYEYNLTMGETTYTMDDLVSVDFHHPLFASFGVGNTCAAELVVKFYSETAPARMSDVVALYREKETSTWYSLGTFFIDTRTYIDGMYTLVCYDSMLKSDTVYLDYFTTEVDAGDWPKTPTAIVAEIATYMGLTVDVATVLNDAYSVTYPNSEVMRTLLGWIAAAHGGNWTVTRANTLLLVPLFTSMPAETDYLVTEDGNAITFAETRILV